MKREQKGGFNIWSWDDWMYRNSRSECWILRHLRRDGRVENIVKLTVV